MKKLIFVTIFMFLMAGQIGVAAETNEITIQNKANLDDMDMDEIHHRLQCFILAIFGKPCE